MEEISYESCEGLLIVSRKVSIFNKRSSKLCSISSLFLFKFINLGSDVFFAKKKVSDEKRKRRKRDY